MAQPFAEFANDRHLLWVANEWVAYSDRLADWGMECLVNRRDVWSQYTVKNGEIRVVMLPTLSRRKAGSDMVTHRKLKRHFSGKSRTHLIGLHSISDHMTCKWFAVDIDLHDETVLNSDEIRLSNFNAAFAWAEKLREQGFDPLLMDSNGVGGFHLWTLLDQEYPLADVYQMADELRSDHHKFGLKKRPEIFPPKISVGKDDLPYGLRLPGRHHTRPHYTRIWNFDRMPGENEWLEGGEAIEIMLETRRAPLPEAQKRSTTPRKHIRKKRDTSSKRARVCMDLDGVLAQYDGWKGIDHIGPPVDGSLEFAKSVAEIAEIVIFTSRCSAKTRDLDTGSGLSAGQMRIRVVDWLEKHGFPYSDVYVGQGKPLADAFIDDRAITCRPQEEKNAFSTTVKELRKLLARAAS